MKTWGKTDRICKKCKLDSVNTWETNFDETIENNYCIRWFEIFCQNCHDWSAWVLLDNGRKKVIIK
jgi:hypothetical protein